MTLYLRILKALSVAALMAFTGISYAQEPEQQVANEKIKASRVEAKARTLRAMRPMLGIPKLSFNAGTYTRNQRDAEPEVLRTNGICGYMYGEKVSCENGIWLSQNLDFDMPNWVACDVDLMAAADARDILSKYMPADKIRMNRDLWKAVLEECWKWGWDKPAGNTTIACGPLVTAAEAQKGKDAVPYEYYLVLCKKTKLGLGYKSIGFLIPNREDVQGGIYKFSQCVNLIEHKSGYDFFHKLPENLQENVEGMTTYELYCSFIEEEAYIDDPSEREEDWMDAMNDYMEDYRDR